MDREPAGARAGPDPARDHEAAERREDVVHEVHEGLTALDRVGNHPDRPEQAGVILGQRDRARSAEHVGDRERDGRPRGDGKCAAGDDDEIGRRQG